MTFSSNTLISDFKEIPKISYKDYEYSKAYQLLNIQGIPSNIRIRKTHNKLFINNLIYNLEDISIATFINILLDNIPEVSAYRYEENPLEYLNTSSLFLADFDTFKVVEYSTSKETFNDYWLDEYKDKFNNSYILESFEVLSQSRLKLPYNKNGNKVTIRSGTSQNFKLFCKYRATDLKINFMQEFPISNVGQLFSMSKDNY